MNGRLGFVLGAVGGFILWVSAVMLIAGNKDEARHEIEADGELQPAAPDIVDLLNGGKREP